MELLNPLSKAAAQKPFEVGFELAQTVLIDHNRGIKPLVQVVLLAIPIFGWNIGGWNEPSVPWNLGSTNESELLPDDEYTLRHLSQNSFIVLFSTLKTGTVIYF